EMKKYSEDLSKVDKVQVMLYGSLAKTGVGHGTDIACLLGLMGADPVTFDVNSIDSTINDINARNVLLLDGKREISFSAKNDVIFYMNDSLPYHPNAMTIVCNFN